MTGKGLQWRRPLRCGIGLGTRGSGETRSPHPRPQALGQSCIPWVLNGNVLMFFGLRSRGEGGGGHDSRSIGPGSCTVCRSPVHLPSSPPQRWAWLGTVVLTPEACSRIANRDVCSSEPWNMLMLFCLRGRGGGEGGARQHHPQSWESQNPRWQGWDGHVAGIPFPWQAVQRSQLPRLLLLVSGPSVSARVEV